AGVAFYVWQSGSPVAKQVRETLRLESDLAPVALSAEELQALKDAGIEPASAFDDTTANLQSVSPSDELDAIDADLNGTDLSGLDAELNQISADLQ
ncbi:MAG: hypothetical protein HYT22_03740, partial [Candidatus Niyogibacteria bacterium]|nr:hypothetical protein [Candidatus Niyogibacteria bacterium]